MTAYEKFENTLSALDSDNTNIQEVASQIEQELATTIKIAVIDIKVAGTLYGLGTVVACSGTTLDNLIIDIAFGETIRKFSLKHIMSSPMFSFKNAVEFVDLWNAAEAVHKELTTKLIVANMLAKKSEAEAAKKAADDKKAAEAFIKAKTKTIADFTELARKSSDLLIDVPNSQAAEFYYSLGWIAKHLSRVYAAIPDYLLPVFEQHFGEGNQPYVYGSDKRTAGGHRFQWTTGLRINLSTKNLTPAPDYLSQYLNSTYNAIINTPFVWDLVDNYGFQFGKKQDLDKIKSYIPVSYLEYFDEGYTA